MEEKGESLERERKGREMGWSPNFQIKVTPWVKVWGGYPEEWYVWHLFFQSTSITLCQVGCQFPEVSGFRFV